MSGSLALQLLQKHCILRPTDETTLRSHSGYNMRWMIDTRRVTMRRDFLTDAADAFWALHPCKRPVQVCGMEMSGISLTTAILMRAPLGQQVSGLTIRNVRNKTGSGSFIEGLPSGDPIILIDDIINTGESADSALKVLRAEGLEVFEMYALVDFESSAGCAWRMKNDIAVSSLCTLWELDESLVLPRPVKGLPSRKEDWRKSFFGANSFHVVPKCTPVVVEDCVFFGTDNGIMHCLNVNTGEELWSHNSNDTTGKGIWSTPAYHDDGIGGTLLYGSYSGGLYMLDATNGKVRWEQHYGDWIGSSPVIGDDKIHVGIEYASHNAGHAACLDLFTGEDIWSWPCSNLQHGSAALVRSRAAVVWGLADHELAMFGARTGRLVWSTSTKGSIKGAPAVHEERGIVAYASSGGVIGAVDLDDGRTLMEFTTGGDCRATPVFIGDRMLCGSADGYVYAFDLKTLEFIGKLHLGTKIYASVVAVGELAAVGNTAGRLFEFDPVTLEIHYSTNLLDAITSPVAYVAATPSRAACMIATTAMNTVHRLQLS